MEQLMEKPVVKWFSWKCMEKIIQSSGLGGCLDKPKVKTGFKVG